MLERKIDWGKPFRKGGAFLAHVLVSFLFGLGALVLWPYLVVAWLLNGEDPKVVTFFGVTAQSLYFFLLWMLVLRMGAEWSHWGLL